MLATVIDSNILLHTLLEVVAGFLAFITGLVIVSRTRQPRMGWTAILGSMYLAVGLMDVLHGLSSSGLYALVHDQQRFIPGTWMMSRLFLLVGFAGSFEHFIRHREISGRLRSWMPLILAALGISVIGYASSWAIPCFVFPDDFFCRPYDAALLLPYVYYLVRYARFSFILAAALSLDCGVQLAMCCSPVLFDAGFVAAHLLKLMAYFLVLVWLELERPLPSACDNTKAFM